MKPKLKILLLLGTFAFHPLYSSSIKGDLSVHQLGAWALYQHNSICQLAFDLMNKETVKPIDHSFKYYESVFLDTMIKNSIKAGKVVKDTHIRSISKLYHQFDISKNLFKIKPKENGLEIILSGDLNNFLNKEQKMYLCLFEKNGKINLDAIPMTSLEIISHISIKLYHDAMDSSTKVYLNDSLQREIKPEQKAEMGYKPYLRFQDWRHYSWMDDPTVGYDTEFIEPYWIVMDSLDHFAALSYIANPNGEKINIEALGFGIYNYNSIVQQEVWTPLGFIRTEDYISSDDVELKFIEMLINWTLERRLKLYDFDLIDYEEQFNIKVESPYRITPDGRLRYQMRED